MSGPARAASRVLLGAVLALGAAPAQAGDVWSTVAPGIEHLHRTSATQDYHVVLVDLARPELYLRATGPGENGQRTSAWAASVGATVAVNGDLWDAANWSAYQPLGLAVGDGWKWRDDTADWSFLACDPAKRCSLDPWGHLAAPSPRWYTAIGGMQDLLVIDGVGQRYDPAYYQQRHPRTATGLTQDGATLVLLTVDGRRAGAAGMTFSELTDVMLEFGAWNAINNDGGGSTTLVIGGAVQNVPSDGTERVVANHLAVLRADHTDAACAGSENARVCVDATRLRTCTGGLDRGVGDCGAFGLACEQEGAFAYCVDPRCANGGQNNVCLDATRIGMCVDGVFSEGDCAGFGLPCVAGLGTAWCWADFHQATPQASSLGAATGGELGLAVGVPTEVWFDLENTGRATWQPDVTKLAPLPRDQASPLAGPGWLSPTRAATVAAPVAPGEVGRFAFTVVAPSAGDYALSLGLVAEGITWFADRPSGGGPVDGTLAVTLHATAGAPDGGGGGVGDGGAPGDGATPAGDGGGVGARHLGGSCGCRAGGDRDHGLAVVALALGLAGAITRTRRGGGRRRGVAWSTACVIASCPSLPRTAVAQGARVLMSLASRAYLDMKYDLTTELGTFWAGFISVAEAYDWDPAALLEGVAEHDVVGIEAPLWTETIATQDDVDFMTFPRLLAYAEIGWSPVTGRTFADFAGRAASNAERLDRMGVRYYRAPQVFPSTR